MSAAYVDTSCLVALALDDTRSGAVRNVIEQFDLFSANLLEAELSATLQRHGHVLPAAFLDPVSWILPNRPLTAEITAVLNAGYVRGADLWHLACACYLAPRPEDLVFLTLDVQQATVARAAGFRAVAALA